MTKQPDPLKRIRIATPCEASWERMSGDERIRHCTLCDLNVYNFAEMTGDEIRGLLMRSEGRVCARMYRRADGTLLTRDCPSGLQRVRQRISRFGSALMAAMLSFSALATGCATTSRTKPRSSNITFELERAANPQQAALAGVVHDQIGLPLPGVSVLLRDEATGREWHDVTDINGAFKIEALPEGMYRVEATLEGLPSSFAEHVALKQNEITRADVVLEFGGGGELVGAVTTEMLPMSDGVTFSIPEELVRKLPIP